MKKVISILVVAILICGSLPILVSASRQPIEILSVSAGQDLVIVEHSQITEVHDGDIAIVAIFSGGNGRPYRMLTSVVEQLSVGDTSTFFNISVPWWEVTKIKAMMWNGLTMIPLATYLTEHRPFSIADNKINPRTGVNIFDSFSSELVAGEVVTRISVWNHTSGNLVNIPVVFDKVDLIQTLNRGDIFRFGTNGHGEINEIEVLMKVHGESGIARYATGIQPGWSIPGLGADNAMFRFINGSVLEFDQNPDGTQTTHVQLAAEILTPGYTVIPPRPPNVIISRTNFTGARFFTVTSNAAGTDFTILPADINMFERLQSFSRLENIYFEGVIPNPPTELAIYMSEGRVRMVVEIVRP